MALGFIVSPAKKMNVVEGPPFAEGTPAHLAHTKELFAALNALSYEEAKALWCCSDRLAEQNYARLHETQPADARTAAVIAYEGIQYQHLAAQVMSDDELVSLAQKILASAEEQGKSGSLMYRIVQKDGISPAAVQLDSC